MGLSANPQSIITYNYYIMKLLSMLVLVALLSFTLKAQIKRDYHQNARLKYQVETTNGCLNGKYTCWYPNGQKKAEGQFLNNQRVGDWKVWGASGVLKVHRKYQNHFQFETLVYQDDNGVALSTPERSIYPLNKNKAGYIEYPATQLDNVYWEKRIWRQLSDNKTNSVLLGGQSHHLLFNQLASAKDIPIYKTDSDDFQELFSETERTAIFQQNKVQIIGYKIKEVQFFELTRGISESRILGICPIIKSKKEEEGKPLCWLKYEDIRPLLAQLTAHSTSNSMVENLDDWLHFRCFQSIIEKETNAYDRALAEYTSGDALKKEQERIEMALIDREHDFWMVQELK